MQIDTAALARARQHSLDGEVSRASANGGTNPWSSLSPSGDNAVVLDSLQRPLAEVHSVSARSLTSNMSVPIQPSSGLDCGASITLGPDSGFEEGSGSNVNGSVFSHLVTGRRDASDGLVEAGIDKYLQGDIYTSTLLLSEAAGQQTNHALELEYGDSNWTTGISLHSQTIPTWMSGELAPESPLIGVLSKRLAKHLKLAEVIPNVDTNYLACASIYCLLNQWDEAREMYRRGLNCCTEKSQLRAALGLLNGLERYVKDTTEVMSFDESLKIQATASRTNRAHSHAFVESKSVVPSTVRRMTVPTNAPVRSESVPAFRGSVTSTGTAQSANGSGRRSSRLHG